MALTPNGRVLGGGGSQDAARQRGQYHGGSHERLRYVPWEIPNVPQKAAICAGAGKRGYPCPRLGKEAGTEIPAIRHP